MTTKEWFERARELNREIRALKREARDAQDVAMGIANFGDGVKVQTSKTNHKENAMVRYLDYSNQISRQIEQLFAVKLEIYQVILLIEQRDFRTLLSLRYLSNLTWEQIADEMEVDVRHVYRLHKSALLEAESLLVPVLCAG